VDIHFYNESDVRCEPGQAHSIDGKEYPYSFIADVPGDNPDVLGDYDNNILADRLQEFRAVGGDDRLDCETCCFYAYFLDRPAAVAFIKKLNAYISQKSRLIRAAQAF
jgi:hypothetical protein